MSIFLRHSYNVPPPRWGSDADVQYAIKVNSEKVYGINPNDNRIIMPLFWDSFILDYSKYKNNPTDSQPYGIPIFKNQTLYFDGIDDAVSVGLNSIPIVNFTYSFNIHPTVSSIGILLGAQGSSIEYRIEANGTINLVKSGIVNIGQSTGALKSNIFQRIAVTYDSSGNWAHYINGKNIGSGINLQTLSYPDYLYIGRSQYALNYFGGIKDIRICNGAQTSAQIALFNDLPYGLYQKVSRPFYLLPTAPPVGWTGEIIGITNPTEILGRATSGISEVVGI